MATMQNFEVISGNSNNRIYTHRNYGYKLISKLYTIIN